MPLPSGMPGSKVDVSHHVERYVMRVGQHGQPISAYLVGRVSVGRDAVRAHQHGIHLARPHQRGGHIVRNERAGHSPLLQSQAVNRAPCNKGRVSSTHTWGRLPWPCAT